MFVPCLRSRTPPAHQSSTAGAQKFFGEDTVTVRPSRYLSARTTGSDKAELLGVKP